MHVEIDSAGGGGWGDPFERDPEAVRQDVLDELVSLEAAHDVYGVVLFADFTGVDVEATSAARRRGANGSAERAAGAASIYSDQGRHI
jgi:N-methylhydantoinase B/oxoprolinase/acetone carboxylase alpha subunit